MNNSHLIIVGLLGGIGFTMCLFLVEMALAGQPSAANVAKLAVLASSTVAATVGAALMAKLPDSSIEAEKLKTA